MFRAMSIMYVSCNSLLGHEPFAHVGARSNRGLHKSFLGPVLERQAQLGIDLSFVGGVGIADDPRQVAERATIAAIASSLIWPWPLVLPISTWAATRLACISAIQGPITTGSPPASRLARY